MTILFFARLFYPHIGGVEKHVMEIGKILVKRGHRVIVVTEEMEERGIRSIKSIRGIKGMRDSIEIIRIPVGNEDRGKKMRIWKRLWELRKVIEVADIVHCHDVFFWYLPFRFFYPRKPVYTTFHGYESYPIRKNAILVRKLSERLSWGNICIGDFIPKWYGTHPTYVSYGAVGISNIQFPISNKPKRESAVFIGRLDVQTGSLEYARAVQLIRKKYPKFAVLFVGDGNQRKQVEKIAKVTGFEKNPEKYFAKYHFAFVSRYLSILEAFSAKRLVFALYDNPVKEDYLKLAPYASWIVIARDAKELAERADYFLTHPEEEKKLVDKAYKWVQKQTWDEMVRTYLQLWKKV